MKKKQEVVLAKAFMNLVKKNENVVVLTADLAGSLKLHPFIKDFPERYFQCGIAEANMMGIAAGLTIGGKIPYTTTFANFSTGQSVRPDKTIHCLLQ